MGGIKKFKVVFFKADEEVYEVSKRRILQGKSVPHYAALEPDGRGLMVISYKPYTLLQNGETKQDENEKEKTEANRKGNLLTTHAILKLYSGKNN